MRVAQPADLRSGGIPGGREVLVVGRDEAVGDGFECGLVVVEAGEVIFGFGVRFEVAPTHCVEAAVVLAAGEPDVDAGPRRAVGGECACGVVGVPLRGVAGEGI